MGEGKIKEKLLLIYKYLTVIDQTFESYAPSIQLIIILIEPIKQSYASTDAWLLILIANNFIHIVKYPSPFTAFELAAYLYCK